jgi:hypothetical protein
MGQVIADEKKKKYNTNVLSFLCLSHCIRHNMPEENYVYYIASVLILINVDVKRSVVFVG